MKRRLMAILLCLSVLLMACACAAETMEPPAIDPGSEEPTSQVTLSEVNEESSKTEEPAAPSETVSHEESTAAESSESEESRPEEPKLEEPTVVEASEITLEKMFSFEIGENGLFSYHFSYPQDSNPEGKPSRPMGVECPEVCAVDENGYLYIYHVTNGHGYVYCATTGKRLLVGYPDNISSISVAKGRTFVFGANPSYGFEEYNETKFVKQHLSSEYTHLTDLRFDIQGNPYVLIPDAGTYTFEGEPLTVSPYPQYSTTEDGVLMVTYGNYYAVGSSRDKLCGDRLVQTDGTIYDLSENTVYQFQYSRTIDKEREIELGLSDGNYTVASYHPHILKIGETAIEAMQINVITAWEGTMYLLAFYPDHADFFQVDVKHAEPIKPEEKETTLEKVLSFDIGIDGIMDYNFLFHDNPSTAHIVVYGYAYTDGNGVFYHTDDSAIIRVNDGARFPFISYSQVWDIQIRGDDFYIWKAGNTGLYGILYHYDISTGFETPTLKAMYDNLPNGSLWFVNGTPVIWDQTEEKTYSVDGKLLDDSRAPFVIEKWGKDSLFVQKENGVWTMLQGYNYRYSYVDMLSEAAVVVVESSTQSDDNIYTSYDQNGNVRTRFLYDRKYDKPWASCAVDFIHDGERYTATVYCPHDAVLGDQTFENLLEGRLFFDVYGNAYYAAYYLDHCDIWSIDQGYSNVQLEDA